MKTIKFDSTRWMGWEESSDIKGLYRFDNPEDSDRAYMKMPNRETRLVDPGDWIVTIGSSTRIYSNEEYERIFGDIVEEKKCCCGNCKKEDFRFEGEEYREKETGKVILAIHWGDNLESKVDSKTFENINEGWNFIKDKTSVYICYDSDQKSPHSLFCIVKEHIDKHFEPVNKVELKQSCFDCSHFVVCQYRDDVFYAFEAIPSELDELPDFLPSAYEYAGSICSQFERERGK